MDFQKSTIAYFRTFNMTIDIANAYNEADRADILRQLYQFLELQPIWSVVDWAYSTASEVLIFDCSDDNIVTTIQSILGVRQGQKNTIS